MIALIVGCGQMGLIHAQMLLADLNITGIYVVEPDKNQLENAKKSLGTSKIHYFETLEHVLGTMPNLGICVIASNTAYHGGNLLRIVSNYRNLPNPPLLFIEKPLVGTLAELENIMPALENYSGQVLGGYLIRYSPISKMALDYLVKNKLTIDSINVTWTKIRQPTRPSAGVLVDEATHTLDWICNYLLKSMGLVTDVKQIKIQSIQGVHSNSVVDIAKQKALYKTIEPPVLADVQYVLLVDGLEGEKITINGHSSFMCPDYKRCIDIVCTDGTQVQCIFDTEKQDHFAVVKNGQHLLSCSQVCNKISLELQDAVCLQLGKAPCTPPAGLEDMAKDVYLTHILQEKILSICTKIEEGERFEWAFEDTKPVFQMTLK